LDECALTERGALQGQGEALFEINPSAPVDASRFIKKYNKARNKGGDQVFSGIETLKTQRDKLLSGRRALSILGVSQPKVASHQSAYDKPRAFASEPATRGGGPGQQKPTIIKESHPSGSLWLEPGSIRHGELPITTATTHPAASHTHKRSKSLFTNAPRGYMTALI
jgi:hypothetical protein